MIDTVFVYLLVYLLSKTIKATIQVFLVDNNHIQNIATSTCILYYIKILREATTVA